MWNLGTRARGFALVQVILAFIFSALWVGIGTGIHKRYETPTPVRYETLSLRALSSPLTSSASSGVGSAPNFQANAWAVNTSGCGWHYLPHYYTSHRSFGQEVACRPMRTSGTS